MLPRRIILLIICTLLLFLGVYTWNQRTGQWDRLCAAVGLEFTGGIMRGLDSLAHRIFLQNEVYQPAPIDPTQPCSYQDDPRYCTGIGLIRYAQRLDAEREQNIGFFGRLKSFFGFGS